MKIKQAIKAARKKKLRISSPSLRMYHQDAKSLVHWLFVSPLESNTFEKLSSANDWYSETETLEGLK